MSLRIRDGKILCAAMYEARPGDIYIDDDKHYQMSVVDAIIVTEPMHLEEGVGLGGHASHGEWWWRGGEPQGAVVD